MYKNALAQSAPAPRPSIPYALGSFHCLEANFETEPPNLSRVESTHSPCSRSSATETIMATESAKTGKLDMASRTLVADVDRLLKHNL